MAKVTPNKLSYAHVGIGSLNHLTGELLKSMYGVTDLQPVPYRGGTPAVADLVSGQVPIGVLAATGQLLEFHRSGRLRILAVTSGAQ